MQFSKLAKLSAAAVTCAVVLGMGVQADAKTAAKPAMKADHVKAPAGFKKVSSLVALPDFIPGLGVLYVDPSTLPQGGPFLGYSKSGKLLNVTYMVPLSVFTANKELSNLGTAIKGQKIDHTDIQVVDAHPGVAEKHVHIVEWLVPHAEHVKELGNYPSAKASK